MIKGQFALLRVVLVVTTQCVCCSAAVVDVVIDVVELYTCYHVPISADVRVWECGSEPLVLLVAADLTTGSDSCSQTRHST